MLDWNVTGRPEVAVAFSGVVVPKFTLPGSVKVIVCGVAATACVPGARNQTSIAMKTSAFTNADGIFENRAKKFPQTPAMHPRCIVLKENGDSCASAFSLGTRAEG